MAEEKRITKEMTMAEIIEIDPEASRKLSELGLFCGGCHMSQFETLEDGALAHGMDPDELLEDLENIE